MDRREFLTASAVAAVSPIPALDSLAPVANRQYIELRRYHLLPGPKQRAFTSFIGDVAIPAMNRAGVAKVGAFSVVYGENGPSLLLVLAHNSLETVVSLRDRLASDAEYARAGRRFSTPRWPIRRSFASRAACFAPSRRCRRSSRPQP